jgi:ABC-2 type transport system ATP-binding protein
MIAGDGAVHGAAVQDLAPPALPVAPPAGAGDSPATREDGKLAATGGATPIIEVRNLSKHYGPVRAVDGISFRVAAGEVFGLLGHNGAGKTTTIRVLTGRTRPTGGAASIAGLDIVADLERVKPLINLVFEEQNLYERFSGRDNLRIFADLYGGPRGRVEELLGLVDLVGAAGRKV